MRKGKISLEVPLPNPPTQKMKLGRDKYLLTRKLQNSKREVKRLKEINTRLFTFLDACSEALDEYRNV